ncbi:RND efflux system, inner membrane transporter CmeB [Klebsiella pneumoniae]|nr:RND efflux system, inner membrane transporter CmeB [Klebsiella pneumoniae]
MKISATYTGASAETLENSVTQVIEQQLTGLDHLLYFSSTSSSDGSVSITVTFEQGTDPDTAQVQVQNKVQQAESRLPSEVQQSGVTVEKSQSSFLLILAVYDKTNRATSSDISDWLVSNMQDPLAARGGRRQPAGIRRRIRDARLDGPDQTRLLLADAFRRPVGD